MHCIFCFDDRLERKADYHSTVREHKYDLQFQAQTAVSLCYPHLITLQAASVTLL
jgi:hypothetical protein